MQLCRVDPLNRKTNKKRQDRKEEISKNQSYPISHLQQTQHVLASSNDWHSGPIYGQPTITTPLRQIGRTTERWKLCGKFEPPNHTRVIMIKGFYLLTQTYDVLVVQIGLRSLYGNHLKITKYFEHNVRKRTFWHMRPTKTHPRTLISLRYPHRHNFSPLPIPKAPSDDSDQIARRCRLNCIFDRRTYPVTQTCLYNFDPLKPHFYIVKLGFTGVYITFLMLKNIDCGYALEPPRRGGSNVYPQSMFCAEIWSISDFFIWKKIFLVLKFSVYLNRHVYVMPKVRFLT